MSFFEQVNGKTVDEYVSDVANGKTPAIAVSRRDFNADQYKALCEAIRNSKAVNNVFLSDISFAKYAAGRQICQRIRRYVCQTSFVDGDLL